MKLLFIQPPIEDFYTTPIRLYPLGLLYAATVAQALGQEVKVIDCLAPLRKKQIPLPEEFSYLNEALNHPNFFKGYYRFGCSDESLLQRITEYKPEVIAVSSQFTAYFHSVARLARLVKTHFNAKVIVGGYHATAYPAEIKRRVPEIDDVLVGPAESALPAYLNGDRAAAPLDWRTLMPAHDLVSAELYKVGRKTYRSLTASRGCPFHCKFCSIHSMFRGFQYRSPDSIIEEIKVLYSRDDTRVFNFEDDNLTCDSEWLTLFLRRIIDEPMFRDIELTATNGVCYSTLTPESLHLMWEAGFRRLDLSYVTHNEQLRKMYRRPGGVTNFETVVKTAQEIGFFITAYLIIGLPGQTYEEVKATIDYLLDLDVLVGPSIFYIPPASELYETLQLPEAVRQNWNLYRSSAFAVETRHLNRDQLLELFLYTRERNLFKKG